ncbi:MAG: hypothetical protein QOI63_1778 [Thermoplasmata archaeon]|jgi:hypothetical protein|nr:hypothetical protein [Thermoplasmata archaeon]
MAPRGLALCLAALLLAAPGCFTHRPVLTLSADGALAAGEHRTWSGVVIQVSGSVPRTLDVPAGAMLELRHANLDGGPGLTLRVNGTLVLDAVEASAVRIVLEPGAAAWANRSVLNLGRGGIVARHAALAVDGSVLHGSPEEWLRAEGGNVTLSGTTLQDAGGGRPGIVADGTALRLDHVALSGSTGYGIQATGGSLRMQASFVASNADYGLQATDADVTLEGNRWSAFCGAFLGNGTRLHILGDTFVSAHRGLTLVGANATVEGARFEGVPNAIQTFGGAARIANGTFTGNAAALRVQGGHLELSGNRFTGNGAAVEVREGTLAAHGNRFEASTVYTLRNRGNQTVDATGNWWGRPAGPTLGPGAEVQGDVHVDPWATTL